MSITLAPRSVPAEFRGKARQRCDAILTEDKATGELVSSLAGRVTDRIRRGNPIPRIDTLVGVASEWQRNIPPRGRLLLEVDLNRRSKSLCIRELRLSASTYYAEEWETIERGLAVYMIGLDCGPFRYKFTTHTLGYISLHALARRMQRGLDADEASVLRDLTTLGRAHLTLADRADGADFVVPVPGGSWRGNVELMRDVSHTEPDKSLLVRMYLVEGA